MNKRTPAELANRNMTLAQMRLEFAISHIEAGRIRDAATWFALAEICVRRAAMAFDALGERSPT